jgi:hypothetical protein
MTSELRTLKTPADTEAKSIWPAIIQVLFLAIFVTAVLWIGLSMVGHRFFRGGQDRHGVIVQ